MGPEPENSAPKVRRGCFQKGHSGNPGGRPKAVKELVEKCRELTPEAVKALKDALDSDDERVVLTAVHEILDRGWGKAPQAITGADGEKLALSISINLGGG